MASQKPVQCLAIVNLNIPMKKMFTLSVYILNRPYAVSAINEQNGYRTLSPRRAININANKTSCHDVRVGKDVRKNSRNHAALLFVTKSIYVAGADAEAAP